VGGEGGGEPVIVARVFFVTPRDIPEMHHLLLNAFRDTVYAGPRVNRAEAGAMYSVSLR